MSGNGPMTRYSVVIADNKLARIDELHDADYDELGLEWALSELRDTYRHSSLVNATFILNDKAELTEFLAAVKSVIGPEALGERGDLD